LFGILADAEARWEKRVVREERERDVRRLREQESAALDVVEDDQVRSPMLAQGQQIVRHRLRCDSSEDPADASGAIEALGARLG
jgi:hypothetical protein